MKSSHPAESSASNYAPSVPMSVYRELAAELRANKAVIDSLNSRNQQLLQQNQFLKKEIHNVVQATLSLGQVAGVARQAGTDSFPSAIAPDTLAKLVRCETTTAADSSVGSGDGHSTDSHSDVRGDLQQLQSISEAIPQLKAKARAAKSSATRSASNRAASGVPRNRVPRPISPKSHKSPKAAVLSNGSAAQRQARPQSGSKPAAFRPTETIPGKGTMTQIPFGKPLEKQFGKLFTEKSGDYRSTTLGSAEEKEIGGIWLVLSIILIIVTAFGAGFLIMKPLLNDR